MSTANHLENVVDEVYAIFAAKRETGLRAAAAFAMSGLHSLGPHQQQAHERIMQFLGTFIVDRADVIAILRSWFSSNEQNVTREAVVDAIQHDARDQLKSELVSDGMPPELAAQVAETFTISVAI